MKICNEDEILNWKTNRCVKKSGKVGKKLLALENNVQKIKTKQKVIIVEQHKQKSLKTYNENEIFNQYIIQKSKRKVAEILIIKLQSVIRGYLHRLKILPLVLYKLQRYLINERLELSRCSSDGRVSSCMDENIITDKLKNAVEFKDKIKIPKERWWYDILVRDNYYGWLPINIKTTTTKTADNTGNLAMCVQAYTDEEVLLHPNRQPRSSLSKPSTNNGSMSKILITKLQNGRLNHKPKKDYYFVVINKTNGNVIVNSVKGLVELTSNLHNIPFQIKWNKNDVFVYGNIKDKVNMFLRCLQTPKPTWEENFLTDVRQLRLIS